MKIFVLSSMITSLIYMSSSHPVLLMVLILIQTTSVCISAWVGLKTSWFSYILFLIFLGGLMVLFVYITSLASNEMILVGGQIYTTIVMATFLSTIILTLTPNSQQLTSEVPSFLLKMFYFMYSWNSMMIIMTTMTYLLLTLVIVIKVSNKFEAPLKNLIFN